MVVTKQLLQQSITTISNAIGAKFIYLPMHQGNPSWTAISQLHLEVYRTSIYITENNCGPPRNRFSLILKFNHMLYNHDMKTWLWYQWRKIWFCIPYKTHSESDKHGSISFMIDNMHYVILRIWEQDAPWCSEIQNKRLEVLGNTFNLHSNSTLRPRSVVSQSVSKGE